jgi:hypothetical protein
MITSRVPAETRPVKCNHDQERSRGCVRAAILMVAETSYPSVAVSNIRHASALAAELAAEAQAHGVALQVGADTPLPDSEIVVRRS